MEVVLAVLVVFAVIWFVTAPLRRALRDRDPSSGVDARLAELEVRKEAKYREIRDAQLDHAQGKLSEPDFRRVDAELRREAVEILKQIDDARG
jgi:flagellar biosynthesis/type III secretory pathway M-ring protein FliF/YscJ